MSPRSAERHSAHIVFLFLVVGLALLPPAAQAHTPESVTLEYDFDDQVLTVHVTHPVSDPTTHYIARIVVEKNGQQVASRDYTSQESSSGMSDTFNVPAEDSDVLRATAFCSISGQSSAEITVHAPTSTTTTTTGTTTTTSTSTTTTTTTMTTTNTTVTPAPGPSVELLLVGSAAVAVVLVIAVLVLRTRR